MVFSIALPVKYELSRVSIILFIKVTDKGGYAGDINARKGKGKELYE